MIRFSTLKPATAKSMACSHLSAKALCASALALSLGACSSVPQDGVIATDMSGSFSQMWSHIFTGELRPAPQPQYSFGSQYVYGGSDATLNTPRLIKRLSAQNHYSQIPRRSSAPESFAQSYVSHSRINPRQRQAPQSIPHQALPNIEVSNEIAAAEREGFGSRLRSMLKRSSPENMNNDAIGSYESFASLEPPAIMPAPRPARSQPVLSQAPEPTPEPRATAEYSPPPAPLANPAQAISQDIGDSLTYVKIGGGSKISEWKACEEKAGAYYKQTAAGFIVEPKFDSCMREIGYMPESEAEAVLSAQAEQLASSANAASQ